MSHKTLIALDTITSHVTEEEAKRFDNEELPFGLIVSMRSEYAWLLYLPKDEDGDRIKLEEMSEGLRGVVEYARAHDLHYICFDRDAEELPGIVTYDW